MGNDLAAATGTDVWGSDEWRQLAVSWLDGRLAEAGIERTGEVAQPHLRPWATVLAVPTSQGPVWMKAAGPGTAFEIGLYEVLTRTAPDRVLAPIATDAERGWIVLPDGGPPLGDRVGGAVLVEAFVEILPLYGRLQRDLAPAADDLLALGVTDMRPQMMPRRFDEALAAVGKSLARIGDAKDEATLRRVGELRNAYSSWCERLAASPVPASVDHNDLHPWNMLATSLDRLDEVRFYDWGDAVLAHPFACMLVPLGWIERRVDVGLDSAELQRVRDAYLKVFADLAPHAELVEALELACQVGKVARALTWNRAVRAADPGEIDRDYTIAPLHTLQSLLDDSYLGGA